MRRLPLSQVPVDTGSAVFDRSGGLRLMQITDINEQAGYRTWFRSRAAHRHDAPGHRLGRQSSSGTGLELSDRKLKAALSRRMRPHCAINLLAATPGAILPF